MDEHDNALSHDNARLRAEVDRLGTELRRALADAMMAWEQAGADRAAYNATLNELAEARAALGQIANRPDAEMAAAKTLHYDMRGWARQALKEQTNATT